MTTEANILFMLVAGKNRPAIRTFFLLVAHCCHLHVFFFAQRALPSLPSICRAFTDVSCLCVYSTLRGRTNERRTNEFAMRQRWRWW